MGSMLYADDITLLAGSCYGLQKVLDICTQCGYKWDITFNPSKSQLLTFAKAHHQIPLEEKWVWPLG